MADGDQALALEGAGAESYPKQAPHSCRRMARGGESSGERIVALVVTLAWRRCQLRILVAHQRSGCAWRSQRV